MLACKGLHLLVLIANMLSMCLLLSFECAFSVIRLLNNNLLEGQVPEELYSIGVHGGAIEYVTL